MTEVPMARTALLIGSRTGTLEGVDHDVATTTRVLTKRGFTVETRTGGDATRAGILDGYERLIAGAAAGDAVVVYYTGHGGRITASDGHPDHDTQYLVPVDIDASSGDDFRGITSLELSVLQNRLTGVTRNVCTFWDCCYSGRISRLAQQLVAKTRLTRETVDIEAHHRRLGLPVDRLDPVSNRDAVRLAACAPWELGYEYTGAEGKVVGMVTEAFATALDEADGAPVSWSVLIERIRGQVQAKVPEQWPGVEGPAGRLVFETTVADDSGLLPAVDAGPNLVRIPGAALLGV